MNHCSWGKQRLPSNRTRCGQRPGVRGQRPLCLRFSRGTRVQAGEGQQGPFLPRAPLVSPQRSEAAVGLGGAAKTQLRRERVRTMGTRSAPRAKARTAPKIRGKEARARALLPWALANSLSTRYPPTKLHQGTSEAIGSDSPPC